MLASNCDHFVKKGTMKKILWTLALSLCSTNLLAANSACLPSLTGFVCKDANEKIVLNRCATNRGDYDLIENNQKLRCHLVTKTTEEAKKNFITLVKVSSIANLENFKSSCNYSSPIDFYGDREARENVQKVIKLGHVDSIRALIYAESHCVNINNHETILSWLGNELLIAHPGNLIQAFSAEEKNMHLKEIAQLETNEWRKFKCKKDSCRAERNTYFASKLTALQHAEIPLTLEPMRKEILTSLQSVTDAAKRSFIELAAKPSDDTLKTFKENCKISSPVDFTNDVDVRKIVDAIHKDGNVYLIRALIYAEPRCTNLENRKNILSWLGNEILLAHADSLIKTLPHEDKKHELYDIAEIENKEWRETKCMGDPCASNRKAYFASKRTALTNAKIEPALEPYRRMLLKGLKSD